jgi:signal transduction histidine kinase
VSLGDSPDLNLRILAPIASYVQDVHGTEVLERIAAQAELDASLLDGRSHWVSHKTLEGLLTEFRRQLESDEEFVAACAYRLKEQPGPPRFLVGALGPHEAYVLGARNGRLISRISTIEATHSGRGAVSIVYRSEKAESRLMCLSRQAQMKHMPELWDMPPAHLVEHRCIARGDECCEYTLHVYAISRWLPVSLGAAAGVVTALFIGQLELGGPVTAVALAALGGAMGYLAELRRAGRINTATAHSINSAFLSLAADESDARRELLELSERQRQWTRRIEQQATSRTDTMEAVVAQLEHLQQTRVTALRGFSHDLRNPLSVMKSNLSLLEPSDEEQHEIIADLREAALRMERLLADLMGVVVSDTGKLRLEPATVVVAELTDKLRARTRALVHGRDIRVSVLPTREAPTTLEIDPLLLDRVLDNLLTNAAKYTERGSIVVELSGTPGFLTVKVSDTGCGIDDIDKVFAPRGARRQTEHADSWGVGLSIVVDLLDRIGGRLEVMSKPNVGTTFWAHFPAHPTGGQVSRPPQSSEQKQQLAGVVSIRKAMSA